MTKIALFDMDNTILQGRFIEKAAETFNFTQGLYEVWSEEQEPFMTTRKIAMLFKGITLQEIELVVQSIELVSDISEVAQVLKQRGYSCGIVTDSYDCVAAIVKDKIGFDFVMANNLEIIDGRATGEVQTPDYFFSPPVSAICNHGICKSNALQYVAQQYGVDYSKIIAIGDGKNDVCMVRNAGVGVAFCSTVPELNAAADLCIVKKSFKEVLDIAI